MGPSLEKFPNIKALQWRDKAAKKTWEEWTERWEIWETGDIEPRKEFQKGGSQCRLRAAELSSLRVEKHLLNLERSSVMPAKAV